MEQIFVLKLENGTVLEACAPEQVTVSVGSMCVFAKDFYTDLAEVVRELPQPTMTANPGELPQIRRPAAPADLAQATANYAKAQKAMVTVREQVERLALPMKLVSSHYSLDGKLLTVQFCSDGRVDFRELVKELSRSLGVRIELRQIGVRDETGIYGGIAVCGQVLCCCRFLKEFSSINVKMAKEQDLSLTPTSISGVCGRLKCCLKYEHAGYQELERTMPRKGDFCDTPSGRGRITDRNLLTQKVSVTLESGNVATFPVGDITVLADRRQSGGAPRKEGGEGKNSGNNRNGSRERQSRNNRKHQGKAPVATEAKDDPVV